MSKDRKRLSLDLTTDQLDRLNELTKKFDDDPTKVQVVRRAISLLELVANYREQGAELEAITPNSRERLQLSLLELSSPPSPGSPRA